MIDWCLVMIDRWFPWIGVWCWSWMMGRVFVVGVAKFSCCGFQNGEGEKRGGKKRRKKEDRPTMTRLITVSRSPDEHEERQDL